MVHPQAETAIVNVACLLYKDNFNCGEGSRRDGDGAASEHASTSCLAPYEYKRVRQRVERRPDSREEARE